MFLIIEFKYNKLVHFELVFNKKKGVVILLVEMHKSNLSLFGNLFNPSKSPIDKDMRRSLFEKICINSKSVEDHCITFVLDENEINIIIEYIKGVFGPKARRLEILLKNIKY